MPFGDYSSFNFMKDIYTFVSDIFGDPVTFADSSDRAIGKQDYWKDDLQNLVSIKDNSDGMFAQDSSGSGSPGAGSSSDTQNGNQSDPGYDYSGAASAGVIDRDAWEQFKTYLTGLMSSTGQIQKDNQAYNAAQAAKTREWQEYMRDSTYQSLVKDLRAAKLNPILAFGSGGASSSTPTATSASNNSVSGDTVGSLLSVILGFVGDILPSVSKVFNTSVSNITSNSTSTGIFENHNYNTYYKK